MSVTVTAPGTYTLTSVLPDGYRTIAAPVISPSDSRPTSLTTYVSLQSEGQTMTYTFRTNENTTYPLVVTLHRGGTR